MAFILPASNRKSGQTGECPETAVSAYSQAKQTRRERKPEQWGREAEMPPPAQEQARRGQDIVQLGTRRRCHLRDVRNQAKNAGCHIKQAWLLSCTAVQSTQ